MFSKKYPRGHCIKSTKILVQFFFRKPTPKTTNNIGNIVNTVQKYLQKETIVIYSEERTNGIEAPAVTIMALRKEIVPMGWKSVQENVSPDTFAMFNHCHEINFTDMHSWKKVIFEIFWNIFSNFLEQISWKLKYHFLLLPISQSIFSEFK